MSVDAIYPTQNEADALAALVPRNPTSTIPVDDYLLRLALFCEREDVRSFLFNRDPFQLKFLSNPNLADSAVSGSLSSTRVENNTSRHFSFHLRSMFLMAPVFTADNLNFGFGVHEHVFNPADFWATLNPGIFGRSLSRFVRDDLSGAMVIALDYPDIDIVQVDYSQLVNSTGQIHFVVLFRRSQLNAIYESGIFNLRSLRGAMESIQASYEIRKCPGCGVKPEGGATRQPCNCELPRAFPKHPLDISSFYRNMERRLGTFQGLARVNFYSDGRKAHGFSVGNQVTITGGVDQGLIERLQKWAISSSALPEDPLQSLMQPNEFNSARFLLPDIQHSVENQSDMQVDVPFLDIDGDWSEIPGDDHLEATLGAIEGIPSDQTRNERQIPQCEIIEERVTEGTDVSQGTRVAEPERSTVVGRISSSGSHFASTAPSKSDADDRELVKKLRAELRKERNRASAQKSNLRKKAENDARKLEIKTNKEKATLLRAREMFLRQENMRLRQQLADVSEEAP